MSINIKKTLAFTLTSSESFQWSYCYGLEDHKIPILKIVFIASQVDDLFKRSMTFNHLLTLYFGCGVHSNVIKGDNTGCNWNSSSVHWKFVSVKYNGWWYSLWLVGGSSQLYYMDSVNNSHEFLKMVSGVKFN